MTLIFKKIPLIMADLGAIGKSGWNEKQRYAFRKADDIQDALHPILAKHGCFLVPEVLTEAREEHKTSTGSTMHFTLLKVRFSVYADDGSSVSGVCVGEGADTGDKSANKAMTAALKYFQMQTFCISTEDAKDSENDSHESVGKKNPDMGKKDPSTVVGPQASAKIKMDPNEPFNKDNTNHKLYLRSLKEAFQIPMDKWQECDTEMTGVAIGNLKAGVQEFKGMLPR